MPSKCKAKSNPDGPYEFQSRIQENPCGVKVHTATHMLSFFYRRINKYDPLNNKVIKFKIYNIYPLLKNTPKLEIRIQNLGKKT